MVLQAGLVRDDYKELLQLAIIFLGGVPPGGKISFKRPGAMSSARWMATALYCLKLCLFRKQIKLPQAEAAGLFHVAIFILRVYLKVWFSASHSLSAPQNDLQLLKDLVDYQSVNRRVATAAMNRFLFHQWYLSEINISFAMFDETLPLQVRESMAQAMLSNISSDEPPKKRPLEIQEIPNLTLATLATSNSLKFFNLLNIESDFLNHPVAEWADRVDYKRGREIAYHLRVVNDTAERAVKLMSDYNQILTKKEESFQKILVGVHDLRQYLPDKKKSTLAKKFK